MHWVFRNRLISRLVQAKSDAAPGLSTLSAFSSILYASINRFSASANRPSSRSFSPTARSVSAIDIFPGSSVLRSIMRASLINQTASSCLPNL